MKIITNHQPRDVLNIYVLTKEELKDFDYIDWKAVEHGEKSYDFFRYKGQLYDIDEFEITTRYREDIRGWDGVQSDTYFSGTLIKWPKEDNGEPDFEQVIVGRFYT